MLAQGIGGCQHPVCTHENLRELNPTEVLTLSRMPLVWRQVWSEACLFLLGDP